jgi:hypothetical protein
MTKELSTIKTNYDKTKSKHKPTKYLGKLSQKKNLLFKT